MNKKLYYTVFDQVAMQYPNNIAIEQFDKTITYKELKAKSNAIAKHISALGLPKSSVIAVSIPASINYVVTVLGIMKSGHVFMPLDMHHPKERLKKIVGIAKPKLQICSLEELSVRLVSKVINVNDIQDATEPFAYPEMRGDEPCYVISTSGSTGEPKSILGMHKSFSHYMHWESKEFELEENARIPLIAPTTFDVSLRDIFVPLMNGATLVLPPSEIKKDMNKLYKWLENNKITLIHIVPSLFRMITKVAEKDKLYRLENLKYILLAGEPLYGRDISAWRSVFGNTTELVNLYGPSETTLAKMFNSLGGKHFEDNRIIPLGQPISNTAVLILNRGKLCEVGEQGEIHIKTPFRSKGYIGNDELNRQVFIQNPLKEEEDILYKTGDIGKYLPDRSIEFIGRMDRQIKISGNRVELNEIESAFQDIEQIEDVIIMPQKDTEKNIRLCAYYTLKYDISQDTLKSKLIEKLTDYMIPSYFVRLEEFPLNFNGKIDKKALPKPEDILYENVEYVAPKSQIETNLVKIWQELFEISKIGINNKFSEYGGNSMLAIKLIAKIYQTFGVSISIKELFEDGSIKSIAKKLSASKTNSVNISKTEVKEYYNLSFQQERLWVLSQIEEANASYNITSAYRVNGNFDVLIFENAINYVLNQHDVFKTSFHILDGKPVAKLENSINFKIEESELNLADLQSELAKESSRIFDMAQANLFRCKVYNIASDDYILFFNIHHIISDGNSLRLLVKEINKAYKLLINNNNMIDNEIDISYLDYAAWQHDYLNSESAEKQKSYFIGKLEGEIPVLTLPTDFKRKKVKSYRGSNITVPLKINDSMALKNISNDLSVSKFTVFVSAMNIIFRKLAGIDEIVTGTVAKNRTIAQLENVQGYFSNTLPIKITIDNTATIKEYIKQVANEIYETLDQQIFPFDKIIPELDIERDFSRNPVFDVMLLYREDIQEDLELPGARIEEINVPEIYSRMELAFELIESEDDFQLGISYNSDLYSKQQVVEYCNFFSEVLNQISVYNRGVREISILSQVDIEKIISKNYTKSAFEDELNLYHLVLNAALKHGLEVALSVDNKNYTYNTLLTDVQRIAAYFYKEGISEEDVVAIRSARNYKRVATALALWKLGATYLPIIDSLPQVRIDYIVKDSDAKYYDEEQIDFTNLVICETPTSTATINPAYVIYTSGTTGKPKGVKVSHSSFVNQLIHQQEILSVTKSSCLLQFHSHSFDGAMVEQFLPLIAGSKSVIANSDSIEDINKFYQLLDSEQVTHIILPPSYLNLLDIGELQHIKVIASAGDIPNPKVVASVLEAGVDYFNLYGPTETSCTTSIYKVNKFREEIPLGNPVYNTYMFIVDEDIHVLPSRAIGEICIAGAALSLGYINRPDDSSFTVLNTFNNMPIYRTGDYAKVDSSGNMIYLGRKDKRIKVRGYRVDPNEIKFEVLKLKSVLDVEVLHDKQQLRAFVKSSNIAETRLSQDSLRNVLPEYSIPEFFYVHDIPKNSNNKTDVNLLLEQAESVKSVEVENNLTSIQLRLKAIILEILSIDDIAIDDNFFKLGGHSLLAIGFISKVNQEFETDIKLKDFFENPTLRSIDKILLSSKGKVYYNLSKAPVGDLYTLSSQQKRIYSVVKLGGNKAYNAPVAIHFSNLDIALFNKALNKVIHKHPILRAHIIEQYSEPMFRIITDFKYDAEFLQIENLKDKLALKQVVDKISTKYIEVSDLPLFNLTFISDTTEDCILVLNIHHIIADGISLNIFISDLNQFYNGMKRNDIRLGESIETTYDYFDYVHNQKNVYTSVKIQEAKKYWKKKLKGELSVMDLPIKTVRPQVQTYNGAILHSKISSVLFQKIEAIARDRGVSNFTAFVSVLKILFRRYTSQNDIIIGTAVSGREFREFENAIGLFSNIIPLRDNIEKYDTFADILKKVNNTINESFEYQSYPFENIIEDLSLERDMSRGAIFDFAVTYGYKDEAEFALEGVTVKNIPAQGNHSKFDILFSFIENEDALDLELTYNTDLYDSALISLIPKHIESILEEVVSSPNREVDMINILSEPELQQLEHFNNTNCKYSDNISISEYFDTVAKKYPNRTALTLKDKSISYSELQNTSNLIAFKLLKNYKLKSSSKIAVYVKRDLNFIPIMLGVMKSGAVYVPIDEQTPMSRLNKIVLNCNAELLITDRKIESAIKSIQKEELLESDIAVLELKKLNPKNAAYIIYSSGTTGEPKGIVATHSNLINTIEDQIKAFDIDEHSKVMQFYSIAFDASMLEVFLGLFAGAELVITTNEIISDKLAIENYLQDNSVSFAFFPPSYLKILDKEKLQKIKTLVTGMEPPIKGDALHFASKANYFNIYGPTETTVICSYHKVNPYANYETAIPIGKAMRNYSMYIMNNEMQAQPIGFTGEICIEGEGLALGYLNDVELTASKFKTNPLTGNRIFCSGDIGKMLPNGEIVYLSRKDNQVKIRGYRIETGEIKSNLDKITGINESYLSVKEENGNKELVAYVVSDRLTEKEIRFEMKSFLPQYMIPKYIKLIDEMPLTANGKIDKNALPSEFSDDVNDVVDITVLNDEELIVLQVWQSVLGKENIDIDKNFFELGGDSIKAIQICSTLSQRGYLANVRDVFANNTITELASAMKAKQQALKKETEAGKYPLSPIQKWFVEQNGEIYSHFNQAQCFEFTQFIDAELLNKAVDLVLSRHSAFRTRYRKYEGIYLQELMNSMTDYHHYEVMQQRFDGVSAKDLSRRMNEEINPEEGKMILFRLIQDGDKSFLLAVAHHFIIDGISWRILIGEIESTYISLNKGEKLILPDTTDSFQNWSKYIDIKFSKELYNIEYWYSVTVDELTIDWLNKESQFNSASFELSSEVTRVLLEETHRAFNTKINDVLLTSVQRAFAKVFSENKQIDIMLESHGREHEFTDLDISETVGWFTTFYPISLKVKDDLKDSIVEVKDTLRAVPNNGFDYIALKYTSGKFSKILEPKISFNYLGVFGDDKAQSLMKLIDVDLSPVMSESISFNQDFVINAVVENQKFKLFLDSKYGKDIAVTLVKTIESELVEIIDFLSNYLDQEITKSDIDFDGFENDDLSDFLNTL